MRKVPSLRRHKPTSQAVVTLSGKDFYLGVWPSGRRTPPPDIQARYERLIAEWLAAGRQLLLGTQVANPESSAVLGDAAPTVAEVLAAYWAHARQYYRKPDGSPSPELACLRSALRPVRLYDDLLAAEFTSLKLKAVRQAMIHAGLTRTTINRNVGRVKRVFKWAVESELVPSWVNHGLQAVGGLKAGRSQAKEGRRVRPVPRDLVERTLPHLPAAVAAMVRVQLLTGMRSGEVCRLRPMDLDRSADVWVYQPAEHKTAHRGKDRVVVIGPQAQAVLVLNALDAMPDGGAVEADLRAPRAGAVELSVRDPGPGIAPHILPKVFETFVSSKETGIGLGVPVSRRIAEDHRGTLSAYNLPAGGACFALRLPAYTEPGAVPRGDGHADTTRGR